MELPKSITFELTHRCNCRCEMCRFWVEGSKLALQEMNFLQIKKIIIDIKTVYDSRGQELFFGLTGGEPFLKKDFFKIINFLGDHGINYDMVSNFSIPNKAILDRLAGYPPPADQYFS